ncbi:MAG: hypothetical protein IJ774_12665 [Selenomonadaceae bacterium]|nr:hypothetical protein [Selenomonadaceae bacterium]
MDKIKFTILGETGSGKTCYLLGMYYEMSAGRDGYSIVAPNRDESRRLVANFKNLTDASLGRKRFPEMTDALQKYNFELQHAFNTILPFEWIDYPGKWLDVSESASSGLTEVENSIYNSTALFICIDGENLTGNDTAEKIERVRDKCSRHISPYLAQLSGKNRGRKFPPIALIITKYDLCNRETDEEEILEVLQGSFSPLFERDDTFIVIVPVSLGSDLQDDDSRGKFSPINLHLPIYMGIWFALKNYIADLKRQIEVDKRTISNYNEMIRDEQDRFFLFKSNDKILSWRNRISENESEIRRLQNEISAMKQSYDRLERELYSINLTFINGRRRK